MRNRFSFLFLGVLLLFIAPASSMNLAPATGRNLNFTVFRDGSPIGYHRFEFHQEGDKLQVDIDVDLKVKALFVTAFRFKHVAREEWRDGRLLRMESETDDDGEPYDVKVSRVGQGLMVEVNGKRYLAPGDILPSNLWNPDVLSRDKFLHPILGKVMPLEVEKLGSREVAVNGSGKVTADGFLIASGEAFRRNLWFGDRGELVSVMWQASDGSTITYHLEDSAEN